MSYDFALERACPHQTLFEYVTLDVNYQQVVRLQRNPINQNIVLYINGVEVPPTGLFSFATLPFSQIEPYGIVSGKSDMLYIQIGQENPVLVTLNPGQVKASDLARDLSNKLSSLVVTSSNKRVALSSTNQILGPAFTFIDPRWADKTSSLPSTARILGAYKALGIIPGRVVSGYKLFPQWQLVKDPTSQVDNAVMIQFSEPLRGNQPIVQASYFTAAQDCRRCFGVRIEFDYGVVNGTYETVQNTDLLIQEFDKFLFTKIGSHWKWPWLGSNLTNRIGGKGNTAIANVSAFISMDINTAFSTYQSIKSAQDQNFPTQMVSDAEFPKALDNVSVQQIPDDPTSFVVSASLVTRSQQPVSLQRVIGEPNPFSVLSSNPTSALFHAGSPGFLLKG